MRHVTFGSADSYEAEERFAIIKQILIREELLSRIAEAVRSGGTREVAGASDAVYNTLTQVQKLTVEVVESIENWRTRYTDRSRAAFMWSGRNYLLRIHRSIDFAGDILMLTSFPLPDCLTVRL